MRKYEQDARTERAKSIDRWDLLPPFKGKGQVHFKHPSGREFKAVLSEKTTRVVLALQKNPIYAPSKIRFGHYVNIINQVSDCRDLGDHIDCFIRKAPDGSESDDYGVYVLNSRISVVPYSTATQRPVKSY